MKNLIKTVALLTDFGSSDHFVGVVKGKILKELYTESEYQNIVVNFIDINHEIPPQDVRKAALELKFAYSHFPEGTVFLCVVDPGVGTERKVLVFETEKYIFVAPDNGLLTLVLKSEKGILWEVEKEKFFKPPFSSTFHARDLFAPLVAYLLKEKSLEESAKIISPEKTVLLHFPEPEPLRDGFLLSVWYVDRFGNLFTNFSEELVEKEFEVFVNGKKVPLVKSYAYGNKGEVIALFGSEGLLEVAIKNGSAYEKLGIPEIRIKWKE